MKGADTQTDFYYFKKPITEDGAEIVCDSIYYYVSNYDIIEFKFNAALKPVWNTKSYILSQCHFGDRPVFYCSVFVDKSEATKEIFRKINKKIDELNQHIQKYRPEFVLNKLERS